MPADSGNRAPFAPVGSGPAVELSQAVIMHRLLSIGMTQ